MNSINSQTKTALSMLANSFLEEEMTDLYRQLAELQKASEGEGKSSAGDKYETSRETINQSRGLIERQLAALQRMQHQLNGIPLGQSEVVKEGALVKLSMGYIWVAVSLGKLEHNGIIFQVVSKDSPLIAAIYGLRQGESGKFRDNLIFVEEVY